MKKLEVPELTPELLDELGGFSDEGDLRDAIRDQLGRQLEYDQHRRAREQITAALTVAANWELPPTMLQRQSRRELQRAAMELQRSGFSEEEIRAHENALRQNSMASTARALKEHFILERIAEDEEIDADEQDYEAEIRLIASQTDESPRRVRARLEKSGSMDVLRNQIIERKVIERIWRRPPSRKCPTNCAARTKRPSTAPPAAARRPTSPKPSTTKGKKCPRPGQRGKERRATGERREARVLSVSVGRSLAVSHCLLPTSVTD